MSSECAAILAPAQSTKFNLMRVMMSEFVAVKTAELVGPALDWCVCMVATGAQYHDDYGRATLVIPGSAAMMDGLKRLGYAAAVPDYSSDWAQGGPLRDKYKVDITECDHAVSASILTESCECVDASGPTALIAMCRAIVASRLGEVVLVPKELIND